MTDADSPRCISCKHWQGDLEHARKQIEKHGLVALSPDDGFIPPGGCTRVVYDGVEVEVECTGYGSGYDSVHVEFEPWFGCVFHEPRHD